MRVNYINDINEIIAIKYFYCLTALIYIYAHIKHSSLLDFHLTALSKISICNCRFSFINVMQC